MCHSRKVQATHQIHLLTRLKSYNYGKEQCNHKESY